MAFRKFTIADFTKGPRALKGFHGIVEGVEDTFGDLQTYVECRDTLHGITDRYANSSTPAGRWNAVRDYYAFIQPEIDATAHSKWANDPYEIALDRDFTPIERDAWGSIRRWGIVFYPQYPVLRYFVDFANPQLKVAVEMDGRQFHDPARDAKRDRELEAAGWTVYRIPGRECYYQCEDLVDIHENYDQESFEWRQAMRHWYCETVEGVFLALKQRYFIDEPGTHPASDFTCESLHKHCTAGSGWNAPWR